jgi:hypothetical protein
MKILSPVPHPTWWVQLLLNVEAKALFPSIDSLQILDVLYRVGLPGWAISMPSIETTAK